MEEPSDAAWGRRGEGGRAGTCGRAGTGMALAVQLMLANGGRCGGTSCALDLQLPGQSVGGLSAFTVCSRLHRFLSHQTSSLQAVGQAADRKGGSLPAGYKGIRCADRYPAVSHCPHKPVITRTHRGMPSLSSTQVDMPVFRDMSHAYRYARAWQLPNRGGGCPTTSVGR